MALGFRHVNSEDEERTLFRVFLIHGRSEAWREVKKFIERTLRFKTVVSVEEFTGEPLIRKVQQAVWFECDCAVAILSADDLQKTRLWTPRPNALFELGYCMGFFDHRYWEDDRISPVVLMTEDRTVLPTDLEGIERIKYSLKNERGIAASFETLGEALTTIYTRIDNYFSE